MSQYGPEPFCDISQMINNLIVRVELNSDIDFGVMCSWIYDKRCHLQVEQ